MELCFTNLFYGKYEYESLRPSVPSGGGESASGGGGRSVSGGGESASGGGGRSVSGGGESAPGNLDLGEMSLHQGRGVCIGVVCIWRRGVYTGTASGGEGSPSGGGSLHLGEEVSIWGRGLHLGEGSPSGGGGLHLGEGVSIWGRKSPSGEGVSIWGRGLHLGEGVSIWGRGLHSRGGGVYN